LPPKVQKNSELHTNQGRSPRISFILHNPSFALENTAKYRFFAVNIKTNIPLERTKVADILEKGLSGTQINVKGWVRTWRDYKNIVFVAINDGSALNNIQVVIETANFPETLIKSLTTGSCVSVDGLLVESQGKGQSLEVQASNIEVYGTADGATYPLQRKGHSLEFLRTIAHLRPRTNTFGAILRMRHEMAYAIHRFFHEKGFYWLHTPIITASDAEGAGAMFRVTTLDPANPPKNEDGTINFSEDFFGKETNLTVSGQLEGEIGALALSQVYTFGPTFRAENSNTTRHLAEFWMIEPEMAFYELKENMDLAEEFLKYLVSTALKNCRADIEFLNKMYDNELITRLESVLTSPFERITYTEAVSILKNSGHKFEYPVDWGTDLQSEHERYLVEKHFGRPVILTDYPKDIKSFYMKLNEDGKTVRAMDVLFPGIGEVIGGSQREEDYDKLSQRIRELNINEKDIWWYLETRKYGTAPHSGFGLGFERLMLFVTGMSNIRDVIPFPRFPQSADF
jgi:asparaginyl-tRNA synthetase